jgi:sulfotransferase family protein
VALDTVKNARYLIIGGTTKAATTSLFFYLKEHPQVCAANWKEVRFFLDDAYPLKSKYRLADGLEKYADFYAHCSGNKLRVEATPDYLYSAGTPCKIQDALPRVKFLFILREPVSRLISWYRFAKQNDDIASDVSFAEYVRQLVRDEGQEGRPQHMLALEQGRYARCLKSYFEVFGRERLHVAFYEEFQQGPAAVLEDICLFAGIEPGFYKDFDFKVYNKTETMRHPLVHKMYIGLRFHVRKFTHNKPLIHGSLGRLRQLCEPFYLKLNTRADEHTAVSPATARFLKDYYAEEISALPGLLDRKVPW